MATDWRARVPGSLMRIAAPAATLVLLQFIGGLGLTAAAVSVIVVAVAFRASPRFADGRGVLAAIVLVCCWVYVFTSVALPIVRGIPGVRRLFVRPLEEVGFQAVVFPDDATEITRLGALLILLAPAMVAGVAIAVRARRAAPADAEPAARLLAPAAHAAFVFPLLLIGALKIVDPWKVVTFGMSGDGRNHFLMTQKIRVLAGDVPAPWELTVPKLPNAFGALFSAAAGSTGTLQSGDLWGIAAVWVVSAGILALAAAIGFTAAHGPARTGPWVGAAVVVGSFFVATNPLLLSTSLWDGFFSLYFGTAILGTLLVLTALLRPSLGTLALLSAGLVALTGSYTFLAPVFAGVLVVELFVVVRQRTSGRRRLIAMGVTAGALALVIAGMFLRSWASFHKTVALVGSVVPVGSDVIYVFTLAFLAIVATASGLRRRSAAVGLVTLVTGMGLLYLMEHVEENLAPGNSYYGSKTIVGTVCAVAVLAFVPAGTAVRPGAEAVRDRALAAATAFALTLAPYAVLDLASPLDRQWAAIADGWRNPDSEHFQQVVDRWGDPPYVWFRVADDPPGSGNLTPGADRLMNFWSPVAWSHRHPQWGEMFGWAYAEMTSDDAAVLCRPIELGIARVYTVDPNLAGDIDDACGPNDVEVVVLPDPNAARD